MLGQLGRMLQAVNGLAQVLGLPLCHPQIRARNTARAEGSGDGLLPEAQPRTWSTGLVMTLTQGNAEVLAAGWQVPPESLDPREPLQQFLLAILAPQAVPAAAPGHLLLHAALYRDRQEPWSQSDCRQAAAAAHNPTTAAAWWALAQDSGDWTLWRPADALEFCCRFVQGVPRLAAAPQAANGLLASWLGAEPRLPQWARTGAWKHVAIDPDLRDVVWGAKRAFARLIDSDRLSGMGDAYRAVGLQVAQGEVHGHRTCLAVGTDPRVMAQMLAAGPPGPPDEPALGPASVVPAGTQHLERLAFACGLKPVLRLDHVAVESLPDAALQALRDGLFALPGAMRYGWRPDTKSMRLDGTQLDLSCLFVARTPEAAVAAAAADALEKAPVPRPERDAATRQLGLLLGYPACCTEAFVTLQDQGANDDWCEMVAQRSSDGPFPFGVNTWRDLAEVLPFYPCRWDCVAAQHYGIQLLAALEATDPAAAQQLERHLRGVVLAWPGQGQTEGGNCLLQQVAVRRSALDGTIEHVSFASALHWSYLTKQPAPPSLPFWLADVHGGGTLVRLSGGWQLSGATLTVTLPPGTRAMDFSRC